jgi:uncharacterized protein (TIGR02118 family)
MVHRLVVSFGQPADAAAFDDYRQSTHIPLVLQLPGLRRLTVGHAQPMDPSLPAPYLVAELDFESAEAMGAALGSPQGGAVNGDLPNFATGGVELTHFEVQELTG